MAQDSVAPRKQALASVENCGGRAGSRIVDLLPKSPSLGRSSTPDAGRIRRRHRRRGVGGAALVITFRQDISEQLPPLTLFVGASRSFFMSVFAVRLPGTTQAQWTPSVFIHLGLAVTFGPVGAGWARSPSRSASPAEPQRLVSNDVQRCQRIPRQCFGVAGVRPRQQRQHVDGTGRALLGGLCAGLVHFVLNSGFVAVVIHLSDRRVPIAQVMAVASRRAAIQHRIRICRVRLRRDVGPAIWHGRLHSLLAPLILLHGFLIRYTRNVHEQEIERAAHQKEREGLLQKAVEASEAERRRIARDLHDG